MHKVWLVWMALACLWAPWAMAATEGAADARAFAQVWRLEGELLATRADVTRTLHVGDTVYVGERVSAAATGEAVLKTQDGGVIAVRPGAIFTAVQFAAEGRPSDNSALQLIRGSLRIVSGWIGKLNRKGSTLATPTATIGIRGTDHEPYVLLDDDDEATRSKPGTYDKVNQGGTTLEASGQSVDIDPGKVGFARSAPKTRALMTLLFPVLLDKVPDFYVPGKFDAEMNELAKQAEANNQRLLQARQKQITACAPADVAKRWIAALDQHIVKGEAPAILDMFAPDVSVKASVRGGDGKMTDLELLPVDFADSVVTAVSALKDYKHRRISIEGQWVDASGPACGPVAVRSVVIEEGRQGNKPYRFESEEKYVLKQIDGVWRAAQAYTRQR
jgi:hypothetical protein